MLLGQLSHDPLHLDFVPSVFVHVDSRGREKLKRKLDRYFQTSATKRKRLESVTGSVGKTNALLGELCVNLKYMYMYVLFLGNLLFRQPSQHM